MIDDLPEKQEMTVYTGLAKEQASLYRAVVNETTAALEEMLAADERAPIFTQFTEMGEMPPEVEDMVARAGLNLFPEREADLKMDCTCPDWSNPCKHIAAVYLLLAEEFDRDPFLLFRLRRMRQGALMDRIGGDVGTGLADAEPGTDTPADAEPLQATDGFWDAPSLPDDLYGAVETPLSYAALPKQLGKFPLWRADEPFLDTLKPPYESASTAGLELFEVEEPPSNLDE